MSKRTFVGAMIVALAVVVMAGGLLASNMGFKLNYSLNQTAAGVAKTGLNTLALPDFRQSGMVTGKNLMDDIGLANVTNVQKFIKSSDTYQLYTGRKGAGPDFNLTPGEGVFVKMNTTVNYIVVGADDPTSVYALNATQAGVSKTGLNFYAYNYHQTAATDKTLMDDIGLANVTNVQKFIKSSDTYQLYTGRKGAGPDFSLVPGEAYFIKMNTTVNYTPSHY